MIRWVLPLLLLLGAACDPCSGLGSCASPEVRYDGILTRRRGFQRPLQPAVDIDVKFVPTSGVALRSDTLEGRTDSEGRFRLEAEATEEGTLTGDLIVYPPAPQTPVRFRGLRMRTTRGRGDLHRLGEWEIPFPYVGYQFHVFYRSNGAPARGIEVAFRRTGGLAMTPDTFRTVTDPRGYVIYLPEVTEHGVAVGDLTVYPIPPYRPFTISGIRLGTVSEIRPDSVFQIGIGDRLPYSAIIVWSSTGQGIGGARVEFRRTGGVLISPDPYVATTDSFGTVAITPAPLSSGEVIGDLVVTPPAPGLPQTFRGIRLETSADERGLQLLGYYGVDQPAPAGGAPEAGVGR